MKNFLTCILLIAWLSGLTQNQTIPQKPQPAKKTAAPVKSKYSQNTTSNLTSPLMHGDCLDKQFSIVFYVVLDSLYSPGLATAGVLNTLVNDLNLEFNRICVSFKNCSTVYIPVFPFNKWKESYTEELVTSEWYTDQTINFYLVDSVFIGVNNTGAEGYAHKPAVPPNVSAPKKDLLVLNKPNLLSIGNIAAKQLFGLFFGLPHTHEEISPSPPAVPGPPPGTSSMEFANGSNCGVHGDGFCDTPADPGDPYVLKDGMGNYYTPPIDNIMSNYSTRCRFTTQQYNYMANVIRTYPSRLRLH